MIHISVCLAVLRMLHHLCAHAAIRYKAAQKPGLDWWGVNYYARGAITGFCTPAHAPGELMTDMKARRLAFPAPLLCCLSIVLRSG